MKTVEIAWTSFEWLKAVETGGKPMKAGEFPSSPVAKFPIFQASKFPSFKGSGKVGERKRSGRGAEGE